MRMCIAKTKVYTICSTAFDTVPIMYIYCNIELVEPSGVNDTHCGHLRDQVWANQFCSESEGCSRIDRMPKVFQIQCNLLDQEQDKNKLLAKVISEQDKNELKGIEMKQTGQE